MPTNISGIIFLGVVFTILGAPIWMPVVMLTYHGFTAKPFWRFSLRFMFALMAVECVALGISVAFYRFLTWLFENMPVPG